MSVEKTKLVTLTGHSQLLNDALKICIEGQSFQPEPAGDHIASLKHYSKIVEDNPYKQLADRLQTVAVSAGKTPALCEYAEELTLPFCEQAVDRLEKDLQALGNELDTLTKEVDYCNACITQLEHFESMDVHLQELFACEFVDIRFGRLPAVNYPAVASYTKRSGNALFVPFSTDEQYCWGMYLTPKELADEVDLTFAALFFERLHIPDAVSTPAEAMEQLRAQREPDEARIAQIRTALAGYWDGQDHQYDQIYSYLTHESRVREIRKLAALHGHQFILMGWVPEGQLPAFTKAVEALQDVEITVTDGKHVQSLSPPVRLKNSFFARPFEFYTKMFGMPTCGEIDPTAFVAITYTLLYGIMFADVGQGLVLALIGYFVMYKRKGMELGRLLVPCGISGAVFGLVFGSVFGYEHVLDPMYRAMGFAQKPIEIMDSGNIMTILFGAVGIGIVLMLAALLINIYSCLKQRKIGAALFGENGAVGFVLYGSAILLVLKLVLGLKLPAAPLYVGIFLPILLLWLKEPLEKLADGRKDWQPESWGGYLVQSFFELFEALLSYITNTVSFLRVGAFVLVHASMMMVFMSLADMAGGAAGIIIAVFGNVFVLALEGLLVGVQSLRLEFYEMFNRFFEGAGREFSPLQY